MAYIHSSKRGSLILIARVMHDRTYNDIWRNKQNGLRSWWIPLHSTMIKRQRILHEHIVPSSFITHLIYHSSRHVPDNITWHASLLFFFGQKYQSNDSSTHIKAKWKSRGNKRNEWRELEIRMDSSFLMAIPTTLQHAPSLQTCKLIMHEKNASANG